MDEGALQESRISTEVPEKLNQTYGIQLYDSPSGDVSEFTKYVASMLYLVVGSVFSIVGIVANIINLIVFKRQGLLSDSATTTLAGLAVSDLFCVTFMFFNMINFAFLMFPFTGMQWDPLSVYVHVTEWPRMNFSKVTCWITAYVALERCACVMFPFKVKQVFTPHRSLAVVCCIFIVIIVWNIPLYIVHPLLFITDPSTNVTILRVYFAANRDQIISVARYGNDIIFPTASVAVVIICTLITITRLNLSSKWRNTNASSSKYVSSNTTSKSEKKASQGRDAKTLHKDAQKHVSSGEQPTKVSAISAKEIKVIKMISLICVIFIICNLPSVVMLYVRQHIPELNPGGRYNNLFFTLYRLLVLDTVNSSINIVVYYTMSTRYREVFRRLFGMDEGNKF